MMLTYNSNDPHSIAHFAVHIFLLSFLTETSLCFQEESSKTGHST